MTQNILLIEINRINNLMNSKKILTESWVTDLIPSILKFSDDAAKKGWSIAKTIEPELQSLSKVSTDQEALSIIAKISNKGKEFADIILPSVMKSLDESTKLQISQITKYAENQLDKGVKLVDLDDIIKKKVQQIETEFNGLHERIISKIKEELESYKPKTKPIKPDAIADEPLKETIEKIFKEWDKIAPGKLNFKDKILLMDGMWFRGTRARIQYFLTTATKNTEQIVTKIVSLMKKMNEAGNDAEKIVELNKRIDVEIESLRKNDLFVKDRVYELIQEGLEKKIGGARASDLIKDLKSSQVFDDYPEWIEDFLTKSYVANMLTFPRYSDNVANQALGKVGKRNWPKWISNFLERAFYFMSLGNPRKLKEIMSEFIYAEGRSYSKGFLMLWCWLKIIKSVVFPAIYSVLDILWWGWKKQPTGQSFGSFVEALGFFGKKEFENAWVVYKPIEDEALKTLNGEEVDTWRTIVRIINPFTWLWSDFKNILDWYAQGGPGEVWEKYVQYVKTKVPQVIKKGEEVIDQKVKDTKNTFKDVLDTKPDSPNTKPITPPIPTDSTTVKSDAASLDSFFRKQ